LNVFEPVNAPDVMIVTAEPFVVVVLGQCDRAIELIEARLEVEGVGPTRQLERTQDP